MKIYEKPKCAMKDCEESAMCLYSGIWVCGRCLEKIHKKEQTKRLQNLMEITG